MQVSRRYFRQCHTHIEYTTSQNTGLALSRIILSLTIVVTLVWILPNLWQSVRATIPQDEQTVATELFEGSPSLFLNYRVATTYPVGDAPEGIAAADFTADGFTDLVVANVGSNNISLLVNDGRGGFTTGMTFGTTAGAIATADFNLDGLYDIVVANGSTQKLTVFINRGGGQWNVRASINVQGAIFPITRHILDIGDFNHDGKPDVALLVVSNGSRVAQFFGTGSGELQPQRDLVLTNTPFTIVAGAFVDGIGSDLFIVNTTGITLAIGRAGDGLYKLVNYFPAISARFADAADFNRDGLLDLALVGDQPAGYYLIHNIGNLSFSLVTQGQLSGPARSIVAGDFNGDNIIDVAIARSLGDVALLNGNSKLGFSLPRYFNSGGNNIYTTAVGDFNNDGRKDFALAHTDTDTIGVLLGTSVGFNAPPEVILPFNIGQITVADINIDNKLDLILGAQSNAGDVRAYYGDGLGAFSFARQMASASYPGGIMAADLSGEGALDLLVSSSSSDQIYLHPNVSIASVQATKFPTGNSGGGPGDIVMADLNRNQKPDIAVANTNAFGGTRNITIFSDYQSDHFTTTVNIYMGNAPRNVVTGDFNGDTLPDLASSLCCNNGSVAVIFGSLAGQYSPTTVHTATTALMDIATADFNQDGISDLAVTEAGQRQLRILLFNSTGNASVTGYTVENGAHITLIDVNGDKIRDLLIYSGTTLGVLYGGIGGTFQVGSQITTSQISYIRVGDFNSDGREDILLVGRDYLVPLLSQ
ncbi:MAG: VCBS repeat-containing protein [Acidobacteriota bacterium]